MRRLVFLDIDGTVVSHRSNPSAIPEPTKEAVRQLLSAGHAVAFATGRSRATARKPMEELDMPDAVLNNGAHILAGGKTVFLRNLDKSVARRAVSQLIEWNCAAFAADEHCIYAQGASEDTLAYLAGQAGGQEFVKTFSEMGDICRLEYYDKPMLEGISPRKADMLRAFGGIELLPRGTCKELGIRRFAELRGFPMRDTVAVGDGENDIGMLREAGLGIAVGGSPDEVRAAADVVADSIEDGGLLKVFRQLGLIRGG